MRRFITLYFALILTRVRSLGAFFLDYVSNGRVGSRRGSGFNQVPDTETTVRRELRQKCELGTQTRGCQARSA
jgi:hypothetical protein